MKYIPSPTFSSPELQKAVTDARAILEGADEGRNRVSSDIKTLEAYLDGLDLKTSFRYPMGKTFLTNDRPSAAAALEYGGSASGSIEEEALVWAPDSNRRSRLLYEVSRWDGYLDVEAPGGPYFWDDATLLREAKPLIETKFEIRKRMYPQLPDFVANLAKDLNVG